MPRRLRCATGGYVYHVLNRAVGQSRIFKKPSDYAAFEKILKQAPEVVPMRLLGYCLLPNHWHLLLWPARDGNLSEYMRWLTVTHVQRWHAHHHTGGTGPLYQGRFKSFPIQEDDHFFTVFRYIERNALRAGLVARAEQWRWGSLWHRAQETDSVLLQAGPLALPEKWLEKVNRPETQAELDAIHRSAQRGCPFGDEKWQQATAVELGLESTLQPRGRPKKVKSDQ